MAKRIADISGIGIEHHRSICELETDAGEVGPASAVAGIQSVPLRNTFLLPNQH
jgi:hypothetical protein